MKKGFTLIEVTVVIVILAILTLIAVPTVRTVITSSKNKAHNTEVLTIEDAAKICFYENFSSYEAEMDLNGYVLIDIDYLKNNGYLEYSVIDPLTDAEFSGDVEITKVSETYTFEFISD